MTEHNNVLRRSVIRFVFIFLFLLAMDSSGSEEKPDKSTTPPSPAAIELSDYGNIVTAEPVAKILRIWGFDGHEYQDLWKAESVQYESAAIGDIDDDPNTTEIVAPNICLAREEKNGIRTEYIKMFINVYQDGPANQNPMGVWDTTYYSSNPLDYLKSNDSYTKNTEIIIDNVDNALSGNEIVLKGYSNLGVFRYNPEYDKDGKFHLQGIAQVHYPEEFMLQSLATADLYGDSASEIILALNKKGFENNALINIYNGSDLELLKSIPIDARLNDESLCISRNPAASPLIFSPGYRYNESYSTADAYIFKWNINGDLELEFAIDKLNGRNGFPPNVNMDMGDVDDDGRDEIVLGSDEPDYLIVYEYENGTLVDKATLTKADPPFSQYDRINIKNVDIHDSDGDGYNEIIVSGSGPFDKKIPDAYLQVFKYSDGSLIPAWPEKIKNLGSEISGKAIGK